MKDLTKHATKYIQSINDSLSELKSIDYQQPFGSNCILMEL